MTRVAVFVDYQNACMGARDVFGDPKVDPFTFGQVYPRRLGLQLRMKGEAVDPTRTLEEVRVYRGEPDDRQSPVAQAACYGSRLTAPGQNVWCHRRPGADFDRVRDDTHYTKPQPTQKTPGSA